MRILQSVSVKKILTQKTKQNMLEELNEEYFQLHRECEQLIFEKKKLERKRKYSSKRLDEQFEKQIAIRKEKKQIIEFQLEQIEILPIGTEIDGQDVQMITEIKIGDHWDEKIVNKTIIIEDGIVKEIRER